MTEVIVSHSHNYTPPRKFHAWPKIQRLETLTMVVTEKIDGTNAAVVITEDGDFYAQSRKRIITPGDDNYGFARWAADNKDELLKLGPGVHHGEWWGLGIQRGYGLTEKRFSLFNTKRWGGATRTGIHPDGPQCCHVVPVLRVSTFNPAYVTAIAQTLWADGSVAAPGFDRPEGVVAFIPALGSMLKVNDAKGPKGPKPNPHDILDSADVDPEVQSDYFKMLQHQYGGPNK
jgi:hypothetical protein